MLDSTFYHLRALKLHPNVPSSVTPEEGEDEVEAATLLSHARRSQLSILKWRTYLSLPALHHWTLCGRIQVPGLRQLWALKWCFPESRPNIPRCSGFTMGTITSSNSAPLSWREEEDKRRPFLPHEGLRYLAGSSPLSLSFPHLPSSRFASRLRNVIWFWNATLSYTWQRCPCTVQGLPFRALSSEVRLRSSGENVKKWKKSTKWVPTKTIAATT